MNTNTKRIGIYAGTFDPVHAGHISFALQALEIGQLDVVYFMPERRPREKVGVEHFGHRVAMLKKATRPHRRLKVIELEDVSFTVKTSLSRLKKQFSGAQLVFLAGSDVAQHIPLWDNAARLLSSSELFVGLRATDNMNIVTESIRRWPVQPQALHVCESQAPQVSSHIIREALRERRYTPGLLTSVARYSDRNWLYVSLAVTLVKR